jgi:hypothetical protein
LKACWINRGFLCGSAAAILFILAKIAKYGASGVAYEPLIYLLVILTGGLTGALLWFAGGKIRR